jgi:hypothetical protein
MDKVDPVWLQFIDTFIGVDRTPIWVNTPTLSKLRHSESFLFDMGKGGKDPDIVAFSRVRKQHIDHRCLEVRSVAVSVVFGVQP